MKQAGVYTILNLITGRCYVGSSLNVPKRLQYHLSQLNNGKHANAPLLADWVRYGTKAFSWNQVELCATRDEAIAAEQRHIDSTPNLYNMARRAGSGPRDGYRASDEAKRKMSEAMKGRPKSDAHRAAISAARKGTSNPAHAEKLRGRKHSPEHCAKIAAGNTGKTHTEAHKEYMRQLMTGRDVTWAASISAAKRGIPWSQLRRDRFNAKHA